MKTLNSSGKRKSAIARATLKDGKGRIRINKIPLEIMSPRLSRLKIMEPLIIAGESAKKVNIDVNVSGGGPSSQADAVRLAISRALVMNEKRLEKDFLSYDRHLLVADVRRKETHKPNCHGKARAKVQKSYR